jgi:HAMP domain-containing protein
MSFLNLRIRGRLYAGFGALVLFCAALAGFAVWQFWAIDTQVAAMTAQSNRAIGAGDIASELQASGRALLHYAFDQDAASFANSEEHLSKAAELLDEATRNSPSEERRAIYRDSARDVAELKAKRIALGDTVKELEAGRQLLVVDGNNMAADVERLLDAAEETPFAQGTVSLEAKVLMVRVANWQMLATREPQGLTIFKTSVARAQHQIAVLEKADLPPNLAAPLADIKADIVKYAAAFDKTGPNLLQGNELYFKTMAPVIEAAIKKMDGAKAGIRQAFQKTTAETKDRIASTVAMQGTVAGAVVLLGLVVAFFIARGIVGPLSGLTSGMKELATGNFGVVLPGLDRKDEVGDMAQAVETFKVKAEQKARDEAEAKIKQDQIAARQRKADMIKLADNFESAVGEIVDTVSSASTQLEASAGTFTSTAARA